MTPEKTIAVLDRLLNRIPDRNPFSTGSELIGEEREALAESLAMWRRLQDGRSKPKERIDAKDQT